MKPNFIVWHYFYNLPKSSSPYVTWNLCRISSSQLITMKLRILEMWQPNVHHWYGTFFILSMVMGHEPLTSWQLLTLSRSLLLFYFFSPPGGWGGGWGIMQLTSMWGRNMLPKWLLNVSAILFRQFIIWTRPFFFVEKWGVGTGVGWGHRYFVSVFAQ